MQKVSRLQTGTALFPQSLAYARHLVAKEQEDPSHAILGNLSLKSRSKLSAYMAGLGLQPPTTLNNPTTYHVTIRHWRGHVHLLPSVLGWLGKNKPDFAPIRLNPVRFDIFGDERSLVLLVESDEIRQLFQSVDQGLQALGIPPSDYPEFRPHVSVAESATDTEYPPPPFSLLLDNWSLQRDHESVWDHQSLTAGRFTLGRPRSRTESRSNPS